MTSPMLETMQLTLEGTFWEEVKQLEPLSMCIQGTAGKPGPMIFTREETTPQKHQGTTPFVGREGSNKESG